MTPTTTEQTRPGTQPTTTPVPDLMAALETQVAEWAPMTETRRVELIEELVELTADPDALDWEYIRKRH